MSANQPGKPDQSTPKPENQTDENHGKIKSPQRDERDMIDVARGSQSERRHTSNGQR